MANVTIGSDPELFLRDTRTGLTMPACGLFGGTKGAAIPLGDLGEGFGLQEDNVMLEFNIPPTEDAEYFANHIHAGVREIERLVRTKLQHAELETHCSRLLPDDLLRHPGAGVFGCSADYDAYRQGCTWEPVDRRLLRDENGEWRFSGGHVHIGLIDKGKLPDFVVAQFADLWLGLPYVGADAQGKRRELYGKAGRYRPTDYGIEYRTLSNFWIWEWETTMALGNRAIRMGHWLGNEDVTSIRQVYGEVPWPDVKAAIESENHRAAADLLRFIKTDLGLRGI